MGKLIKTVLEEMETTSEKQQLLAQKFDDELKKLKESLDRVEGYWNADDGRTYVVKFRNLKNYLDDQSNLIRTIGEYFHTSKESYDETDKAYRDSYKEFCSSLEGSI